jgi:hypothetical protein
LNRTSNRRAPTLSPPNHRDPSRRRSPTPGKRGSRRRGALASLLWIVFATGCAGWTKNDEAGPTSRDVVELPATSEVAAPELTAGWIDFLEGLAEARRGLEDPSLFPPAPSDRNLAEGYRYLLGHLARIIEAQTQRDPDFPYFQRSVRMLSKWTIDNPDTMYLSAAISADGIYRIRGQALDTTEWQTSERGRSGPRAPRVVIFQTTTAVVGDTGGLAEMAACRNQTLDSIDQFALELDEEGRFEIVVAARKPQGYEGHFLVSRREMPCRSPFGTTTFRMRDATQLNLREIFSDWSSEIPLDLEIVRLDKRGLPRPPRTSLEMGEHLSEIGRKLGNQIKFWNALHELGLEVKGDRNGDGRLALPLNGLNQPAPPLISGASPSTRPTT